MLSAIVGINWGDEGKGRMVDLLSQDYDVVVRYQGGNNAGHTVINHLGKFVLNLMPSGILRPEVVNVMGNGMVIDLEHLHKEMGKLSAAGVKISPENLKISDRAIICLPYHVLQDCLEEERLGDAKYGSTRRGIAPVYGDKYMKKGIRMGDLLQPQALKKHLEGIVSWKNLMIEQGYGAQPIDTETIWNWLKTYGDPIKEYICDTGLYLDQAEKSGKKIMFEAQLGALRDIDFGIYPYTSSSNTIAAYAPIGEYGAATGRPRRVGPFDVPASRYGVRMQGADELALTKMDVLSGFEKIPVCVAYEVNGKITKDFPFGADLDAAKPVVEYLDGWNCDITKCRKLEELPLKAQEYIRYLEQAVECKIRYVSVGAEREAYIELV